MTRRSFRSGSRPRVRLEPLLLASVVALALSAVPVSMSAKGPGPHWQVALARGGGAGGGGPGGHGSAGGPGSHGRDAAKEARGQHGPDRLGSGGRGQAGNAPGYHDVDEFLDTVRNGKAFGVARRDERVAAARERYQAALGNPERGRHAGDDLSPEELGPVAHHFSPAETEALIERGWKGPSAREDGFRNHGERVRTMVELAKRLGYGARVGALQANFGTPYETGIAALEAELAEARAAGDRPRSSVSKPSLPRRSTRPSRATGRTTPGRAPISTSTTTAWSTSATWMRSRRPAPAWTRSRPPAEHEPEKVTGR
jgi:hypothetical protein